MKKYIRALGIDDSYFVPHIPGSSNLVGVIMRYPNYIEGMLLREIEVDGMDVTDALLDMLSSKYGRQIKVIFTQGITFGGFNVLDLERVWKEYGIPIIVVSRKMPDLKTIEDALKKHFEDWEVRMKLIKKYKIEKVQNGKYEVYAQIVGIERSEAERVINAFTVRGAIPEPLRVAHIIASTLHFGESRGKP